ncbi:MAG: NADH-quinone oxidoreductase subunit C [Thermodesulfobacteriota bacterium]
MMRCVRIFDLAESRPLAEDRFREFLREGIAGGDRLLAFFAEEPSPGRFLLHAVVGGSAPGRFAHGCAEISGQAYSTFTDVCPAAHWFEREVYDQFGIVPEGHPELNPLRFHEGWPKRFFPSRSPEAPEAEPRRGYRFLQVRGEGIHEVSVGPVHAGVIEPGHFRFSCAGETIQHLEIRLGYQHKGTESLLAGKPGYRHLILAESISGDTAVGHSNACARLLEALLGRPADPSAESWRSIALELERIANHVGDLGGLATDIGYLFGAAHFAHLRGQALGLLTTLTGNRYGRGLNRIGGLAPRIPGTAPEPILDRLRRLRVDAEKGGSIMLEAPSVVVRMEGTGCLRLRTATTLGIVGPAGRASGRDVDARRDFPSPCFAEFPPTVILQREGDVLARARERYEEMLESFRWLSLVLPTAGAGGGALSGGSADAPSGRRLVVSVEEGWRGEIVHAAVVDEAGGIAAYKVVDPSFHNWPGLAFAVRENVISDFPLCNKSFNLSYSGADL